MFTLSHNCRVLLELNGSYEIEGSKTVFLFKLASVGVPKNSKR